MTDISFSRPKPQPNERSNIFMSISRKSSLADEVVAQIEEAIVGGRLQPNDRLPTEGELCKQFEVSRTVVREAMRILTTKGLVDVRPGSGAVICEPSTQVISDYTSLLLNIGREEIQVDEIAEVRRCLELQIASEAAERRTDRNLAQLESYIDNMRSADDAKTFVEFDMAFHLGLAEATQNRLYLILLNTLVEVIFNFSLLLTVKDDTRERAIQFHVQLLEAVRDRDRAAAQRTMKNHLETFAETLQNRPR